MEYHAHNVELLEDIEKHSEVFAEHPKKLSETVKLAREGYECCISELLNAATTGNQELDDQEPTYKQSEVDVIVSEIRKSYDKIIEAYRFCINAFTGNALD